VHPWITFDLVKVARSCRVVDGVEYMWADLSVRCDTGRYKAWHAMSVLMLVLWVVVGPGLLFWHMRKSHKRREAQLRAERAAVLQNAEDDQDAMHPRSRKGIRSKGKGKLARPPGVLRGQNSQNDLHSVNGGDGSSGYMDEDRGSDEVYGDDYNDDDGSGGDYLEEDQQSLDSYMMVLGDQKDNRSQRSYNSLTLSSEFSLSDGSRSMYTTATSGSTLGKITRQYMPPPVQRQGYRVIRSPSMEAEELAQGAGFGAGRSGVTFTDPVALMQASRSGSPGLQAASADGQTPVTAPNHAIYRPVNGTGMNGHRGPQTCWDMALCRWWQRLSARRRRRPLHSFDRNDPFFFLRNGYTDERWYWELVIFMRKLSLILLVVLAAEHTLIQGVLASLLLISALMVHLLAKPLEDSFQLYVELGALLLAITTLQVAMFYFEQASASMGATYDGLGVFTIGLLIGLMCLYFVVVWGITVRRSGFDWTPSSLMRCLCCPYHRIRRQYLQRVQTRLEAKSMAARAIKEPVPADSTLVAPDETLLVLPAQLADDPLSPA